MRNAGLLVLALSLFALASAQETAMKVYPDQYYQPQQQGYQTNAYYNFFLDEGGRAFVLLSLDVGSNTQLPTDLTVYIPGADVDMKYVMIQGSTGSGNVEFEKIADNTYELNLPAVIVGGGAGVRNIVFFYRVGGYVSKGLLNYDFDVQTVKWPFDVDFTRVGVAVDSGLYLKGGQTQTDYKETFGVLASASAAMDKGVASQEYQSAGGRVASLASQARYGGTIVKDKRNLEKFEVFHVKGEYADAAWKLYALEWLGWLALTAVILFLAWKFAWPAVGGVLGSIPLFSAAPAAQSRKKVEESGFNFGRVAVTGFVSSILYALVVDFLTVVFILANPSRFYPGGGPWGLFIFLVLGVGVAGFFAVLSFAGNRFSWTEGVVAGILFVGFSIVLVPVSFFITYMVTVMLSQLFGDYGRTTLID